MRDFDALETRWLSRVAEAYPMGGFGAHARERETAFVALRRCLMEANGGSEYEQGLYNRMPPAWRMGDAGQDALLPRLLHWLGEQP